MPGGSEAKSTGARWMRQWLRMRMACSGAISPRQSRTTAPKRSLHFGGDRRDLGIEHLPLESKIVT